MRSASSRCSSLSRLTSPPLSTPPAHAKSPPSSPRSPAASCPPGPSGAPTRGRADCLPTGRNFYSVDVRAVPTPAAWELGRRSADLLAERYFQDEGEWPKAMALTVWGTSNMRTGGDDIAQALALIGARPVWEGASGRVTGVEVIPLAELRRPRVDVTLRISGFFRDAFPTQIALFHEAVQAVAERDEPADANPIAARIRADARSCGDGRPAVEQARRARRVLPRVRLEARSLWRGPAGADRRGHLGGAQGPRRGISRMVGLRLWRRFRGGGRARSAGGAAEGDRRSGAEPGQSRARSARFGRLLSVRGRARGLGRDAAGRGAEHLSQRPFAPGAAGHPRRSTRRSRASCVGAPRTRNGSPA